MNWDQIEEEWTTMTRRIRADWRDGPACIGAPRSARDAPMPLSTAHADAVPPDKGAGHGNLPTLR